MSKDFDQKWIFPCTNKPSSRGST